MKKGFSIIEVLFAVAFLIMVGLAMISLNAAALRLINSAELQTVANSLNEESIAVVALTKKSNPSGFANLINSLNCGANCYIDCPADNLSQPCSLSAESKPVQLGRSKLQFIRTVKIKQVGNNGGHSIQATVRWGSGIGKETTASEVIE